MNFSFRAVAQEGGRQEAKATHKTLSVLVILYPSHLLNSSRSDRREKFLPSSSIPSYKFLEPEATHLSLPFISEKIQLKLM